MGQAVISVDLSSYRACPFVASMFKRAQLNFRSHKSGLFRVLLWSQAAHFSRRTANDVATC
eukprot:6201562-Pleurochrysis_carterae.AAC.1